MGRAGGNGGTGNHPLTQFASQYGADFPHASPQARATRLARAALAASPTLLSSAPGRVNLIGEHTDYSGGYVLPISIDRRCCVAVTPAPPSSPTRIITELGKETISVDLRAPIAPGATTLDGSTLTPGSWPSYVVGVLSLVAEEARAAGLVPSNLSLAIASDVPPGSGLSSSAAVEVSVAASAAAWNLKLAPGKTAAIARAAEHLYAKVPCGIMDQYISELGAMDHALLIDCRSQERIQLPMPSPDQAVVLVVNSNVRHSLASGEYALRRDACLASASILNVPELRDATPQLLAGSSALALRPDLFRIARHVVTENLRTLDAADALQKGDLSRFGSLMNASHDSLRDDYHVSSPELDTIVEAGRSLSGVFGARMTGGGFGGCVVMLIRPSDAPAVQRRVRDRYVDIHGIEPTFFITRASAGASVAHLSTPG